MRVGMIMARLPVLGPTHPKAWGLFFCFAGQINMVPNPSGRARVPAAARVGLLMVLSDIGLAPGTSPGLFLIAGLRCLPRALRF
jgi:hypothetical protein